MLVLPMDAAALSAPALWLPQHAKGFLAMAALSMLLLTGGGRYRARLHMSVLDELPRVLANLLTAGALVATVFALRHEQLEVTAFLSTTVLSISLVIVGRVLTHHLILLGRRRRIVAHRTVVVGDGPLGQELITLLERYPQYGLVTVGVIRDRGPQEQQDADRPCGADKLNRMLQESGADVIILAGGGLSDSQLFDMLRSPSCARCDLIVVPRLHQFCRQAGVGDHIGAIPVTRVRTPRLNGPAWGVKRAADVVFSALALTICAPIILACAAAIRLETRSGVLFRQDRVGRDGRRFVCVKFQSMPPESSSVAATRWSIAHDDRVGRVGRMLRKTGLDELPQLWNILRGDMTLVGPRPERPHFVNMFSEEFPHYRYRHRVPAGLTGLAQVSGLRGDVPISDRARFDNYYIENWSLWLDVKIVLRTFAEVALARGR